MIFQRKTNISLLLLLGSVAATYAQLQPDSLSDQNRFIELLETSSSENDHTDGLINIQEHLLYYLHHPLNLNKATHEEFLSLGLSEYEISHIIEYRSRMGGYVEVRELKALRIFEPIELKALLPYLTVKDDLSPHLKGGQHFLIARSKRILESKKGNLTNAYNGDAWGHYLKYRYTKGINFSTGFTLEKDPGEAFFSGSNQPDGINIYKGFDYASGHVLVRTKSFINAISVGDYSLNFGQGLILWNGFSFSKSAYVDQAKKSSIELLPYTSANETIFLRGAAITLGKKSTRLTVFCSRKKLDANVIAIDSVNMDVLEFSSLQSAGLHRTESEIADENQVTQTLVGSRLGWSGRRVHLGFTGTHTMYDASYSPQSRPDTKFNFSKNEISNAGMDYLVMTKNVQFFGENALSSNGGSALLNGMNIRVSPALSTHFLYRNYSRDYYSPYAQGFGESSSTANESGLYTAIHWQPEPKLALSAYYDVFKHSWLRYNQAAPTRGSSKFAQATFTPSIFTQIYIRLSDEVKTVTSTSEDSPIPQLSEQRKLRFRVHLAHEISYLLQLRSRVEWSFFEDNQQSNGFLIYQDVIFRFKKSPFRFNTRIAFFDTPSFQSAIYAYESDVLYSFSVPAYSGQGMRLYVMIRWKLSRKLDLWIRYAQTKLANAQSIGSGNETIVGNSRSEIKFQFALRI